MNATYEKQWEFLKRNFESGNLSHAYLFSGQDVESIKSFTKEFIEVINSAVPQADRMIRTESFPDLLIVKSSDSKSSKDNEKNMMETRAPNSLGARPSTKNNFSALVSIEQIRQVQNFLSYKAYYGGIKSVVIEHAERMNQEAQSCFLKTLEEPKGKTVIFLLTSKPDFLLPTIFSRCQQVKFFHKESYVFSEEEQKVLQDLRKIMNSDLAEKFNYAKKTYLEEGNFSKILVILQKYFRNLLLAKIGVFKKSKITEEETFTMDKVRKILEMIENLNYQASVHNINQKLALEILLLEL